MRKISQEELQKILENHKHWINMDCDGWGTMRADLREADLREAYLRGADLREADLRGAYLRGAYLRGADLRGAYLRGADLRGAYLRGADLREAYLRGADLREAKNIPLIPMVCPEVGSFIAYKKASDKIVELEIPADARRSSATTRKCRCDKAKVLRILNYDRTESDVTEVKSNYNNSFVYRVGEIVSVDNFDDDRWNECSTGIHFFMSFQEAFEY